jgi:hypothetical protein
MNQHQSGGSPRGTFSSIEKVPSGDLLNGENALDMASINPDAEAGAEALSGLIRHVNDDWERWEVVVVGFRALRNLAFVRSGTNDIHAYAYRQEIGALLREPRWSIYSELKKQTRSACYKLMDNLDEISDWYRVQSLDDRLQWKSPKTIAKHCPSHLLSGGQRGHNARRAPSATAEEQRLLREVIRLRGLLTEIILLQQVQPPDELNDRVDDLFGANLYVQPNLTYGDTASQESDLFEPTSDAADSSEGERS